MPVCVKPFKRVEINPFFDDICNYFGFSADAIDDYEEELVFIQFVCNSKKQVEMYTLAPEGFPSRVNHSWLLSYYIGLYHGRVMPPPDYDPLIVVTFRDYDEGGESKTAVVLHTMIIDDEMFGVKKRKHDLNHMRWIRQHLTGLIEGNKSPDDFR